MAFVNKVKENYKHIVPATVLLGLMVAFMLTSTKWYLGVVLLFLSVGLLFRNNIVRKLVIGFFIMGMILTIFGFYPPFTDPGQDLVFPNYSGNLRLTIFIILELLIIGNIFLLKNSFGKKGTRY